MKFAIKRYHIITALLLLLLVAIPISTLLLSKRQTTRTRAGGGGTSLLLNPDTARQPVGQEFPVQVALNTDNPNITGIDVTLLFNAIVLEVVRATSPASNAFNSVIIAPTIDTQNGKIHFVYVNTANTSITGFAPLADLVLKLKSQSTGTITFQSSQITAAGQAQAIATNNNSSGTYNGVLASLTPTVTLPPSSTPLVTAPVTPSPVIASPAVTLPPGSTGLSLSLLLPGISSVSAAIGSASATIKHPQRQAEVFVVNANGQSQKFKAQFTFNPITGFFTGVTENMGNAFPTGLYIVKVRLPNTLVKRIPGIITITQGQIIHLPATQLVSGDLNGDNILDPLDFNAFRDCYRNPGGAGCDNADLNDDGKKDEIDLNIFLRGLATRQGD